MIPRDTVLFASDDSEDGLADARAYIARFGLTGDDVKMGRKDGQCLVVSKRDLRKLTSSAT